MYGFCSRWRHKTERRQVGREVPPASVRIVGVYSGGHRADWLPLDLKRAATVQENRFYGGVLGSTAGTATLHSGRRRGYSWKTPGERVGLMPGEGTWTPARVWGAVKVPAPQLRVLPCRFSKNRRGATLCLLILLTLVRLVSCGAPELMAEGFAEGSAVGPVSRSSISRRF